MQFWIRFKKKDNDVSKFLERSSPVVFKSVVTPAIPPSATPLSLKCIELGGFEGAVVQSSVFTVHGYMESCYTLRWMVGGWTDLIGLAVCYFLCSLVAKFNVPIIDPS